MSKFWLPTEAQARDIRILMNEDTWFSAHQELLLSMANTNFGRDLLCIPKDYPLIVKIEKNCIHALLEYHGKNQPSVFMADFRIGAKWANVIRNRWDQFNSYARYFKANGNCDVHMSPLVRYARAVCIDTLTAYPDPNPETTTVDGTVHYGTVGTGTSWSSHHDSTTGSPSDDGTGTGGYQGKWIYADAYPFWRIMRGFFLFDTSSLGSSATISAATGSLYFSGTIRNNWNNGTYSKYTWCASTPASNTSLAAGDFDNVGTTHFVTDIAISALTQDTYNVFTMNASGLAAIDKVGVSKFAVRLNWDIDNSSPPSSFNDNGDGGVVLLADTAGTSSDPKLIVTYTSVAALTETMLNRTPIRGAMRGTMRP